MAKRGRQGRKLLAGGLTGAALAGLAVVAATRRPGSRWSELEDPCGPQGLTLPDGEARTVTTDDGADLDLLVAGPADGPTVVLPHCWTGTKELWAPVARRLVAAGHRVVLYDQRGHGRSGMGRDPITTDRLGHDLLAVLDAVGGTDLVLAGHSMGGMTIQALAATHPDVLRDRVRGVALVATAAKSLPRPLPGFLVHRVIGDAASARLSRPGREVLSRGAVGIQAHRAHVEATHSAFASTSGAARAGFLVAMSAMDYRPVLASIGVPTTVVVGTHDRLAPPARARVLAKGIPGAELVVLQGMGHMLPLEAPDQVAEAIAALAAPLPRAALS